MTKEERCRDFLAKLQLLSEETGVYVEHYGDQYYNPQLIVKDLTEPQIYFELDFEENKYVARTENAYDGPLL